MPEFLLLLLWLGFFISSCLALLASLNAVINSFRSSSEASLRFLCSSFWASCISFRAECKASTLTFKLFGKFRSFRFFGTIGNHIFFNGCVSFLDFFKSVFVTFFESFNSSFYFLSGSLFTKSFNFSFNFLVKSFFRFFNWAINFLLFRLKFRAFQDAEVIFDHLSVPFPYE